MYLLDTTVVSDFARGHGAVLKRLRATPPSAVAISALTRFEVRYGLALRPAVARRLGPVLEDLFAAIRCEPFDVDHADEAARLRSRLRRLGTPIGAYDLLIAATAVVGRYTLVTSNAAEFRRVTGLTVEDWRD